MPGEITAAARTTHVAFYLLRMGRLRTASLFVAACYAAAFVAHVDTPNTVYSGQLPRRPVASGTSPIHPHADFGPAKTIARSARPTTMRITRSTMCSLAGRSVFMDGESHARRDRFVTKAPTDTFRMGVTCRWAPCPACRRRRRRRRFAQRRA